MSALIAAAREWVSECVWGEDAAELAELSDGEIVAGVDAHYAGGWDAFVRDGG